jgi:hypothetical protein
MEDGDLEGTLTELERIIRKLSNARTDLYTAFTGVEKRRAIDEP